MADVNGIPVVTFTAAERPVTAINFHNHWEEVDTSEDNYSITLQEVLDYIGDGTFSVNGEFFYVPIWMFTKLTNDAVSGNFANVDTLIPFRFGSTEVSCNLSSSGGGLTPPLKYEGKYITNKLAIPVSFEALNMLIQDSGTNTKLYIIVEVIQAYINPSSENAEFSSNTIGFYIAK